jgi:hypothetical protein
MSAWVYPTDNGWSNIAMRGNYGYGFALSGNGTCGSSNRLVYWDQSICSSSIYSALTYTLNTWQHVAVTVEDIGTQLRIYFYLDGVQDGPYYSNIPAINNGGTSKPLYIAEQGECFCNFFGGNLDELRIWSVVRTKAEIQASMNNALTGSESGLVAYYKMNEGSGTSLADSSSNSNTGTLTNMTNAAWVDGNESCCGGSDYYNITNVSGHTKEDGTTATFKVALKSAPGQWELIAKQANAGAQLFSSNALNSFLENANDSSQSTFMSIGNLNQNNYDAGGKYKFKLVWGGGSSRSTRNK